MADDGYSGFWVLGGFAAGMFAGYKLLPRARRISETEKLEIIAQRIHNLAEHDSIKLKALEEVNKIRAYRKGLKDRSKNPNDAEHRSIIRVTKDSLKSILTMINPWSSDAKDQKDKTLIQLD